MQTPVFDFVKKYAKKDMVRLHMPGHKGRSFLGCEKYDITEIKNAGVLYENDGIISQSEKNAATLFGVPRTFYSTEGSSLCIKAMLSLCIDKSGQKKVIAARNVHKAFVHAAALLDAEVIWLKSNEGNFISCQIDLAELENLLKENKNSIVYLTSPDYLGNTNYIKAISLLCKNYGALLCVDNAHGAYLGFVDNAHPIKQGADICSDSAHKTLPVLTGGAYLHLGEAFDDLKGKKIKDTMSVFGSTSPSYLTLASLDLCNKYLSENYKEKLSKFIERVNILKAQLKSNGWFVLDSEPLKITILANNQENGFLLADKLRAKDIEPEFCDNDFLVLMLTPENSKRDLKRLVSALGKTNAKPRETIFPKVCWLPSKMSIRQAVFSDSEVLPVEEAVGRICANVTVSCPPAIPLCVSGEVITDEVVKACKYYKIEYISVIKKP